ncbi:intracellular protein transport protein USO1 isoform X2 [Cimex lectularius]|uniref:Centrobin n=1 Tax=Cimex lectularius TaxID=79782 RepID=A0A8I6R8E1_CIMLE|nr:intracellular protein transport protein USO1 isoform X2 [Cimex lectularius]
MSDSDDTDILLLIPPKFFTVPSDQEFELEEKEKKEVVSSLVSQVNSLENRVNVIESFTSSRCGSSFGEEGDKSDLELKSVRSRDKESFLKEIDVYLESVKTVRQSKENSLKEAKHFLGMEDRAIDTLFQNGSPSKRLALPEVDKLLKEMEITQNEIENKLKAREIEYGMDKEKQISPRKVYLNGENIGSVPDLNFGVREMFNSPNTSPLKAKEPPKPPIVDQFTKRDEYLVGSSNSERRSSISSVYSRTPKKDTDTKMPERRYKAGYMSPRRRLQMTSDYVCNTKPLECKTSFIEPEEKVMTSVENSEQRFKPEGLINTYKPNSIPEQAMRSNLLSLADLWKSDGTSTSENPSKLRQKLEEEKYRRLHLENTIQTLNRKVLEEQEKLAVAMRVDEGKDKAIGKITEAWKQMVEHWKEIEAERHSMSQKLISERTSIKRAQEDINKKIDRWEKEVSQALDLAAGFKGKCEYLEAELTVAKETADARIRELEDNLESKETTLKNLMDERAKLMEKLRDSEENNETEKKLVEMARNEVTIVQKNLSDVEAELAIVKEQKELLSTRLKEEKGRNQTLEQQKNHLQEALTESKAKQALAEEEAKVAREQLDKAKTELRTLYQNQLESVVRDKLAEFQGQLDAAQASMQAEIDNNKKIAHQKAEQQKSTLINSHLAEIRRLESLHKEEMRELSLKLAESEKKRLRLENGKKDIAQKLHGVMETQWQQALSIITSELSMRQTDLDTQRGQGDAQPVSSREAKQFKIIPDVTESDDNHGRESEVGSQPLTVGQSTNQELLKYIQMLLEKQPGKPVDSSSSLWQDTSQSEIFDPSLPEKIPWHQIISGNFQNGAQDAQQMKKPPWK